jgi:primosomal protein N' (replication factor Y) (superfamily II helicase)
MSHKHLRWRVAVSLPLPAYDFQPVGEAHTAVGKRVLVPWQGGARVGVVLEVLEGAMDRGLALKDSIAVLDHTPIFTPSACAAMLEISRESMSFEGLVYQDFLPWGAEPAFMHRVRLVDGINLAGLPEVAHQLTEWCEANRFDPAVLDFFRSQGLLNDDVQLERPNREIIRRTEFKPKKQLTDKQQRALEVLRESGEFNTLKAWSDASGVSSGVIAKLLELGVAKRVLESYEPALPATPDTEPFVQPRVFALQEAARLEAHQVSRLHGGKPKDRFEIIAALMRQCEGEILYLAPDHTRLQRAFKALGGFGASALLHGGLKPLEREAVWQACARGEIAVLFGTPMALFAPLNNIKLIVLEDELSDAWKLHGGSRLFVPDATLIRAHHAGAKLLFAGSVPAAESLELPGVVLNPPRARLHIVDFSQEATLPEIGPLSNMRPTRNSYPISTEFKRLLRQTVERGRQAVVIAPRRGYSAVLRCKDCAWVPFCPNCDVPLRFHASSRALECHQCGFKTNPPNACPTCEGTVLAPRGPGSEWIERELAAFLPQTKVYRFDRDRKDDLERIYAGSSGIIVGTTAVLQLEPPPDLALIALTFADTMHSSPDFRASERFHALIRQLLEWHPTRAPLLLVQTFQGGHAALLAVRDGQDVQQFPHNELPSREMFLYPPYAKMAQVQIAARRPGDAEIAASKLGGLIRDRGAQMLELLGPAPAPIARVKGLFVFNLLVRAQDPARLAHLLEPARGFREGGVRVRIDVNPRQLEELLE